MRSAGALALLLAACAGSTDTDTTADTDGGASEYVGLWKLSSAKESEDCRTYTDETFPLPYQRIVESEEVPGALEVRTCTGAEDCRSFANEDGIFRWNAELEVWRYLDTFGVYNGDSCSRRATERTIAFRDDGALRIEGRKAEEPRTDAGSEDQCDKYAKKWDPDFEDLAPQSPGSADAGIFACERWIGDKVAEAGG
ncbi:MAG: hypothetical protein H6732_04175 [Alphaproteobacteria bacterium]|nr:hypothetical protein [Alphaproteobacteria bacterium]